MNFIVVDDANLFKVHEKRAQLLFNLIYGNWVHQQQYSFALCTATIELIYFHFHCCNNKKIGNIKILIFHSNDFLSLAAGWRWQYGNARPWQTDANHSTSCGCDDCCCGKCCSFCALCACSIAVNPNTENLPYYTSHSSSTLRLYFFCSFDLANI